MKFEVASVKPNKSNDGRVMIGMQPGGRYTATNVPLRQLIRQAYQVQETQLVGGPEWIRTERFDITARAEANFTPAPPGSTSPGPLQYMLRALLADRFKLVVHNETRELPVYALTLARGDGKLGPKLRVSTTDCAALMAAARGRAGGPPAGPPPGANFNEPMQCGMRMGPGLLSAGDVTMEQLANNFSNTVQRIVLDRTGLTGRYSADLSWTPEQMPQLPPDAGGRGFPQIDPNGPSIFTAVQEQLGLKLESTKAPIAVIVIDNVEPPTPD
jgi:uncharacterized protein (TIGR03435 family)